MSFPRYAEYKDSGVEWLGEVPRHWKVTKIKNVAAFSGGGTPSRDNLAYWNGSIPWVSPKDMKVEEIVEAEECITEEGLSNSSATLVPPGTVLMVVRSGILRHTIPVAINGAEVALNQDMKALALRKGSCQSRFFLRWVQGLNKELLLAWAKQGATVESIEQEYLANTAIALPPFPEQSAITAFLDREAAKIDALVDEQGKLIELLKEMRQAVISHAVTKGLDPTVPMKDSGIEWLGEVPAHWTLTRIKRFCSYVVDCLHTTPTYDGDLEYPAIRTADVDRGVLLLDQVRLVSQEVYDERIQRLKPIAGDILYSREGERFGMAALVPEGVDLCLGQRMMMFRMEVGIHSGYVMWLLNSDAVYKQVLETVGGSTSPHVNISDVINFNVPSPPLDEQRRIADHVSRAAASVDALVKEAQRAIDLLKERRSALISAAVTGKIDVRGLVGSESSSKALESA